MKLYPKKIGKKGMFLTFISIAIVAAIIIIFTPSTINLKKDISSVRSRVSNVNDYVDDLENVYLERTLHATGRRAIISLIDYMKADGFLANFEQSFRQALLEGTIGATEEPLPLMTGNTFNDKKDDIINTAQSAFNIQTEFDPIQRQNVTIHQVNPWFVSVGVSVHFKVTTEEETASWEKTANITVEIPIEDFEDPYYIAETSGQYINAIKRSNLESGEWDGGKVIDHINDGTYVHFANEAPSFVSRFTGDMANSNCCGIESLVNPDELAALGLDSDRDTSYVDYLFWSSVEDCANPPLSLYGVDEISAQFPNFKFDLDHLAKYGLSADEQVCPP